MVSSQKINFRLIFAILALILFGSVFHHVQRRDLVTVDSISVERAMDCSSDNDGQQKVIDEEKDPELFKPKIIYYNRVGKCGSRSLLSAISKTSKGVHVQRSVGL